jgi:hypothetical protein
VTVAHPALGNDVVGKLLHVGPAPFEHRDFETARLVEVHVQRRLRQIVTRVVVAGEPPRQFALFVLVNINERGNAGASAGAQVRRLLQAGAGKIAMASDRLA